MIKRILGGILQYLCPGVIQPFPAGMTPDPAALFGLMQLMANLNVYAQRIYPIVTAGTNSTLTAAQAIGGRIRLTAGASGGFTITLPSTASILTALGKVPTDGSFSKVIAILNDGVGQTGTLTVGDASTTITGTATIATDTNRTFLMTVTAPTTITFQNWGSNAI